MSRFNLKKYNKRDTLEQTESKVSILSDSEEEKSTEMSENESSTGLRGGLMAGRIKNAKTPMMAEKPKRSRIFEQLQLDNVDLTATMQNRLSAHDSSNVLDSEGFTFVDDLAPIPNLSVANEETVEDLVDFSPSPASLHFQQTLSEQECFADNIPPQKSTSPVSLRCFKPENHQKVTEYVPAWKGHQNDLKQVVVEAENLLQLTFKSVRFLHHPLMSLEHFLVHQLQEFHRKYQEIEARGGKQARKVKKLQRIVLKMWSEVKRLRNAQNYSNTALRLVIVAQKQFSDDLGVGNADRLQIDELLDLRLVGSELVAEEGDGLEVEEVLRRKVVESTKFTLKIWCDGVLVAKSDPHGLNRDFELDFCQNFPIRLTKPPDWFTVELYEHPKGLLKKKIADFKIDLPNPNQRYNDSKWTESDFERREIVHYKHAGIGSGFTLNEVNQLDGLNLTGTVYTRGLLTYKIGWQNTVPNRPRAQNDCVYTKLQQTVDRWGCLDQSALERLLDGGLNGNDFGLNLCNLSNHNLDYFRLSSHLDGRVSFCLPEDLNRNIRLKYLKLRDQHEIEFAHVPIPNRVRELPLSLIRDFERRKSLEREAYRQTGSPSKMPDDDGADIETSRALKQRRLKRFYAGVFRVCEGLEDNMTYASVVDEKYLIYFEDVIRTCLNRTLNWFRWRPKVIEPLPRLVEPKQPGVPRLVNQPASKVQVKIFEVRNLLLRDEEEVRPIVEVCFDNWRPRVPLADCRGRDSWTMQNEVVVELPLKYSQVDHTSPDSFSGSIDVNLLDDVSTTYVKRYVWLGTVKIPMAALISTYQLSGWFLVQTPPLITGYRSCQNDATNKKQESSTDTCTYLRLELKITPNLPSIEPNMANLPSNEPPYIRDHAFKWNNTFNASFPNRKFNVFALDVRGRTSCITRFLKPLGPPQLNFNDDLDVTSPEQCLRYVSLIPFTDSQRFYNNVWLTSDQLIDFCIGSVVDHCITLVCFLLALKLEAYLILGYGIPNGFTSHVLLMDQSVCRLLDVNYNRIYDLNDPFCPLLRVFSVVGADNVWGNVQRSTNIQMLRFDLKRRSDWWPLFEAGTVAPSARVVDVYTRIGCAIASGDQLEALLEQKLKRKFARWRSNVKTSFNQRLVRKSWCRQQLGNLENQNSQETLSEIHKTLLDSNVEGTIIQSAFTTSHSLIKQVKRLEMHVQPQTVTEFVLVVFVQTYPGSVWSVWVLIGAVQCSL